MRSPLRELTRRARRRWERQLDRRRGRRYVRRAAALGLEIELHPTARIGRRLVMDIRGGEPSKLTIGAGSYLEDDCVLRMRGGHITIGTGTFVRRFSALNVAGRLEVGDEVAVSWGCTLHAAEHVRLASRAGLSERVTVTDSRHLMDDPDVWFYHQTESSPTVIGRNSWVASNAVVGMGVTIGERTIVAANSTVVRDVPSDVIVGGSPAKILGPSRRVVPTDAEHAGA